jgi:UDP-glucose:glycoprotein glucosyltransferase
VKPKKQFLTGYGVGLDLKKTDYLALDDRRSKGSGRHSFETRDKAWVDRTE